MGTCKVDIRWSFTYVARSIYKWFSLPSGPHTAGSENIAPASEVHIGPDGGPASEAQSGRPVGPAFEAHTGRPVSLAS